MICNTRRPNPEKLRFATEKGIPAVYATWLWECIRTYHVQPYDEHLLTPAVPQPQKAKARDSVTETHAAPLSGEESLKHQQKKALGNRHLPKHRVGLKRSGTLELALSGPPTPNSTTESSANAGDFSTEQDAQPIAAFDGAGSQPLQDVDPSVNSQRRPTSSSNNSSSRNTKQSINDSVGIEMPVKAVPVKSKSRTAREPSPDSVFPAESVAPNEADIAPIQEPPKPHPKDYSDVLSKLLANRKPSTDKDTEPGRRRRKLLGRAPSSRSNQSTADNALSNQSSVDYTGPEMGEFGEEDGFEVVRKPSGIPQPSQELGWDSPGAQEARERMILAMGGKVEGGLNVLEGIGVVKDKADDEGLLPSRTTRKRRG
jgi:DNA replication regulator DPB11